MLACAAILALPPLLRAVSSRFRLPWSNAFAAFVRGRAPRDHSLRLVETLVLPERASLHVVEAGGRRLLVGRGPGTLSLLCELGTADER